MDQSPQNIIDGIRWKPPSAPDENVVSALSVCKSAILSRVPNPERADGRKKDAELNGMKRSAQ
jgi:hypothetical protein